ncbi:vesicle-associated protein 2-2 [Salvia miltiorrhiza]|uniref:vesicle-associated protein 2-2 n=1 Tax=Salvia miltiorrhiza TaxID=226208 RepID=UPI0025AB6229|nr:vesicle-associated protein 2-2 [Salvia miltiorrhiza]XP_057771937.1 vesicle-associated protein 2-2 [Salvia miltiorrhiza]
MNTQLVEIQPRELKFICEVKKQSSCAVHLLNATDQYVAFKVKTTSPKKYCVRPNIGIIKPKANYDFTVTMQAQKSVPSDMQCKDKFLIQSTVVPYGTSEEEITSSMFAKDSQKYIEETKLRVFLTSAPSSPVKPPATVISKQEPSNEILMSKHYSPDLMPVNGVIKQETHYETPIPQEHQSPVLLPVNGVNNQELHNEPPILKDTLQNGFEDSLPSDLLPIKPVEAVKFVKNMEESRSVKVMDSENSVPAKDDNSKQVQDLEEVKLKLIKEIEELRSKISAMDSKLVEAEYTIEKLKIEQRNTNREKETLKEDLAMSSSKSGVRKVQVGFPPLFVCMVALISLIIGNMLRA